MAPLTFQLLEGLRTFQFTRMYGFVMDMNASSVASDQQALNVRGMTCNGCARTIERLLSRVHGVENAQVDFELGLCVVRGTAKVADPVSAITQAGYGATTVDQKSPVIAGAAMVLSSVSVVTNALLLRRWRPAEAASVRPAGPSSDQALAEAMQVGGS